MKQFNFSFTGTGALSIDSAFNIIFAWGYLTDGIPIIVAILAMATF